MKRLICAALAAAFLVAGCGGQEECKEKRLSDGTLCLVCSSSDIDGSNKRVSTSCNNGRQS